MSGDDRVQRELELWQRRRKVAELYLRQMSQSAIAAELGISQPTVSRDIESIQEKWIAAATIDFNEARGRELARIDVLEAEYWRAFELSKQPTRISEGERYRDKTGKKGGGRVLVRKEAHEAGDARFLAGVQWCIEQRCKLLGLVTSKLAVVDWREEARAAGIEDVEGVYREIVGKALALLDKGA